MDRHTKAIIATLCIPSFMIGTDFTGALLLVIPIEQDFAVDITTSQWVLNAYALSLAMMLVAGGRLGDMFGRKRFLQIGLLIFFLASLACTIAPSMGFLIGARVVQGIGSAIAWPCMLAVAAWSVDKDKLGVVMGLMLGSIATGNSVAPFIAGILGGLGEWRMFFVANVVLAGISVVFIWRVIPRDADEKPDERIDVLGMAVLSLAVFGLLYGLDIGADWGWTSVAVVGLFVFSVVMFVAFPIVERWVRDPMVPPPMMKNHQVLLALLMNGFMTPPVMLLFLYLPQYYHKVFGWSAMWSAIGILPILIVIAIGNTTIGRFYNTIGPKRLLASGYALAALASLGIVFMPTSWGYVGTIAPMLVMGVGGALVFGPAGTAAVSAADPSRAGLAGGLSYMFHLGLGAIGVAGATAILFVTSRDGLARAFEAVGLNVTAADQAALNTASAHGEAASGIIAKYGADAADKIHTALGDAFAAGMQQSFWLPFAFAALGFILALCLDAERLRIEEG